jgi:hypothetical protein
MMGVTGMADLPIMCTLGPDALKTRKVGLLDGVARLSRQTVKITAGYRFEFTPTGETLLLIADMIDAERQCRRFLRFALTVEPDAGPVRLDVTGPEGTLMLDGGANPRAIQKLAGWTTLRMLERYGHVRDAEVQRAMTANADYLQQAATKTATDDNTRRATSEK